MKIPNYDRKGGNHDRRNSLFGDNFRMLIAGQSNCGKTNTLMHLLRRPLVYYDKLYMYTPNQHQDKIQDLKEIMDKISRQVGYNVLEIENEDGIRDTSEYPNNNKKIVIFDDLVNASEKTQKKIANHYSDGRHNGISPIYLSQSYFDIPQKIRLNCSHMALYPPTTKTHLNLIGKENLVEPNLFKKLNPYEFLFLDKEKKSVKKNFDEEII